jgi:DNA mismatch endonuclease (patch repair protein)
MGASGMVMKGANTNVVPKTKTEWWLDKINGNIANDTEAITALQEAGWGYE